MAKNQENSKEVRQIRLFERKELITDAIDDIRDNIEDPTNVRIAIAKLLVKEFSKTNQIVGCIIGLADSENLGEIVVDTVVGLEKCTKAHIQDIVIKSRKLIGKGDGAVSGIINSSTNVLSILIQLKGEVLGIMVLVGVFAFDKDDQIVMEKAEKFTDSVIIGGRNYYHTRHLVKIYQAMCDIDDIRDQRLSLPEMIKIVSGKVLEIIKAQSCAILIYNIAKDALDISASTGSGIMEKTSVREIVLANANSALEDSEIKLWHSKSANLNSMMCLPLIMGDQKIGVICVLNRREMRKFTSEDRQILEAIGKQLDTAVFDGLEKQKVREIFGQMVDEVVMDQILKNLNKIDFSFRLVEDVTVFFMDLRSSTQTLAEVPVGMAGDFTNECLDAGSRSVKSHGGTVNKFLGDGLMGFFNLPIPQKHAALNAIKAAIGLQKKNKNLRKRWRDKGINLPMGIGIYTGEVRAGLVGSRERFEYTVTGHTVNCTDRICSKAARKPREKENILVDERTYQLTRKYVIFKKPRYIEGKENEDLIKVYPVIGLRKK